MHSHELPVSSGLRISAAPETSFTETPLWSRFVNLTQQHRDLDCTISALADSSDELLLARLKKRKLRLKDEIERVASDLRLAAAAVS
ncbi:MAG TPA: DUF465 domain-containing protein [Rhizomicrobium sp.]|nr:DUF465 domain-containing protein [Rhizomicrobium sp.]